MLPDLAPKISYLQHSISSLIPECTHACLHSLIQLIDLLNACCTPALHWGVGAAVMSQSDKVLALVEITGQWGTCL